MAVAPTVYPITSGYGWRTSPRTGEREFHAAIDIGAPLGTTIYAPFALAIISTGFDADGYGNFLVGELPTGRSILIAHMQHPALIEQGRTARDGNAIGIVGFTGNATGPHVHLELYDEIGRRVDPTRWYYTWGYGLWAQRDGGLETNPYDGDLNPDDNPARKPLPPPPHIDTQWDRIRVLFGDRIPDARRRLRHLQEIVPPRSKTPLPDLDADQVSVD